MRDDSWKAEASAAMDRYAQGGDGSTFLEVVRPVQPRLRAFLARNGCGSDLAKDLTQDTFVAMHRHRSSFECGTDVMTWAFTIARRLLIDELRKDGHRRAYMRGLTSDSVRGCAPFGPEPGTDRPDDAAVRRDLGRRIMEVLARLPEEHSEAFGLVYIDGLSIPQAAQVLDVRRGTVSLRVHRACKALREQLGDEVREWLEDRR